MASSDIPVPWAKELLEKNKLRSESKQEDQIHNELSNGKTREAPEINKENPQLVSTDGVGEGTLNHEESNKWNKSNKKEMEPSDCKMVETLLSCDVSIEKISNQLNITSASIKAYINYEKELSMISEPHHSNQSDNVISSSLKRKEPESTWTEQNLTEHDGYRKSRKLPRRESTEYSEMEQLKVITYPYTGEMWGFENMSNLVTKVIPGGFSEKNGLVEGCRILEVNDVLVPNDQEAIRRALLDTKNAGKPTKVLFGMESKKMSSWTCANCAYVNTSTTVCLNCNNPRRIEFRELHEDKSDSHTLFRTGDVIEAMFAGKWEYGTIAQIQYNGYDYGISFNRHPGLYGKNRMHIRHRQSNSMTNKVTRTKEQSDIQQYHSSTPTSFPATTLPSTSTPTKSSTRSIGSIGSIGLETFKESDQYKKLAPWAKRLLAKEKENWITRLTGTWHSNDGICTGSDLIVTYVPREPLHLKFMRGTQELSTGTIELINKNYFVRWSHQNVYSGSLNKSETLTRQDGALVWNHGGKTLTWHRKVTIADLEASEKKHMQLESKLKMKTAKGEDITTKEQAQLDEGAEEIKKLKMRLEFQITVKDVYELEDHIKKLEGDMHIFAGKGDYKTAGIVQSQLDAKREEIKFKNHKIKQLQKNSQQAMGILEWKDEDVRALLLKHWIPQKIQAKFVDFTMENVKAMSKADLEKIAGEKIAFQVYHSLQQKISKESAPNEIRKKLLFPPGPFGIEFKGKTIIKVLQGSVADLAGVSVGWSILKVNGVKQPNDTEAIIEAAKKTSQANMPTTILFSMPAEERHILFKSGSIGIRYEGNCIVEVQLGSQAEKQGVRPGWIILEINNILQPDNRTIIRQNLQHAKRTSGVISILFKLYTKADAELDHVETIQNTSTAIVPAVSEETGKETFTANIPQEGLNARLVNEAIAEKES